MDRSNTVPTRDGEAGETLLARKGKEIDLEQQDTELSEIGFEEEATTHTSQTAPPALFVSFPKVFGLAFSVNHLKPEAVDKEDGNGEVEIPEVLIEREVLDPTAPEDGEQPSRAYIDYLAFLREDMDRRKRIFAFFLICDITYCCFLLVGGMVFQTKTQDGWYDAAVVLLVINITMNLLTLWAVFKGVVCILNLFLLVEGVSVVYFLFKAFSPLSVMRFIMLLLGAQVRTRMVMYPPSFFARAEA